MHIHEIDDANGDLLTVFAFCSDSCHQDWCTATGEAYGGWNGCHEGGDYAEYCASCGVFAGGAANCECQSSNVVVNRFITVDGEVCEHGNYIQLPANRIGDM